MRYTVSPIFAPAGVPLRFKPFPAWMALRPSALRAVGDDASVLLPAVHEMQPR